jgi:hypothetical protein
MKTVNGSIKFDWVVSEPEASAMEHLVFLFSFPYVFCSDTTESRTVV